MLPKLFLILLLLSFAVNTTGYAWATFYTWKDANGTLNITDQEPPDGAEILDISPGVPEKPPELNKERQPPTSKKHKPDNRKRDALHQQAAALRQKEAAARKLAEKLMAEAAELRSRSAIQKVKRRYRRQAHALELEAKQALEKADEAAGKAEKIEKIID